MTVWKVGAYSQCQLKDKDQATIYGRYKALQHGSQFLSPTSRQVCWVGGEGMLELLSE